MRKNLYITIHYTQHSGLNSTINESKFAVVLEYIYIWKIYSNIFFPFSFRAALFFPLYSIFQEYTKI